MKLAFLKLVKFLQDFLAAGAVPRFGSALTNSFGSIRFLYLIISSDFFADL